MPAGGRVAPGAAGRRALLLAAGLLPAACDMPRDPRGTTERVQGRTLRIGVAPNPPWTDTAGPVPGGVEAEAAQEFAASLQARPDWLPGAESRLLEALERFELDLVIGGLTQDSPWRDRIGPSQPYLTVPTVLATRPGEAAPADLDGLRVAVRRGDPAAARLRAKGAIPEEVPRLVPGQAPAAAEDWRLAALGLAATGTVLRREEHVMAVAPGENGFLLRLERFLLPRAEAIRTRLQALAA